MLVLFLATYYILSQFRNFYSILVNFHQILEIWSNFFLKNSFVWVEIIFFQLKFDRNG